MSHSEPLMIITVYWWEKGTNYTDKEFGKNFIIMIIQLAVKGGPWCFSTFFVKDHPRDHSWWKGLNRLSMGWEPLLTYPQIDRIFSENDNGQFLAICKYIFGNACQNNMNFYGPHKVSHLRWEMQKIRLIRCGIHWLLGDFWKSGYNPEVTQRIYHDYKVAL